MMKNTASLNVPKDLPVMSATRRRPLLFSQLTLSSLAGAVTSVALAYDVPSMSPYTTDRLAEANQGTVNYIAGNCSSKGGMTQSADLVTLSGNNQWSARNVTLDLGAKGKVFSVPELHLVNGGSILVESGTLRLASKVWLESGGGTLSLTGSESCLDLTGNVNFGTGDLSDFSLLGGASMTGACNFVFGANGTRAQYGRIDDAAVSIATLAVGNGGSGNVMDVSDSVLTLSGSLTMGNGTYKQGYNRLTISNTTVTATSVNVGQTMSRCRLEIAGGSSVAAGRMNVGYRGSGDVLTNSIENSVLVTGTGTTLSLSSSDNLNNPAIRIGYLHSASNTLTVADGATVNVYGTVIIGQENDSRGNTLLVDHATLTVQPSVSGQFLAVGYAGLDNALIADNGATVRFVAADNYTARLGRNCRILSRNGSEVSIGATVGLSSGGVNPTFVADNGTLSFGKGFSIPGSKYPIFEMRGASPSLNFASISYNGPLTNVFVLGAASLDSTRREDAMLTAGTITVNAQTGTKFVVRIESGCPDGEYRLMTWESSNWVDDDFKRFFVIEAPEDYKAELHYKYKDFPGTGHGTYFTVSVRRKKGLVLLFR